MIAALLLAPVLLADTCSRDEPRPPGAQAAAEMPVTVGQIEPVRLAPGSSASAIVPVTVASGFRVQANPASNEFLVPLELVFKPVDGVDIGEPVYPVGQPYRLDGADEDLSTYVGEIEISVAVDASQDATFGERAVVGELRFQACNSKVCLFPSTVPVELVVEVAASE